MLFQGQEFGASTPFLYFADHHPELAKLVQKGRTEFLNQFESIASAAAAGLINPEDERTFLRCKLDSTERQTHPEFYELHRDLIKLRREDPVFKRAGAGGIDGAVLGMHAFVLRFFGKSGDDRLLLVNLGVDLRLRSVPEPLIAPAKGADWESCWSSEELRYGGGGTPAWETNGDWKLPGQAAVVLKPCSRQPATDKSRSGASARGNDLPITRQKP